MEHWIPILTGGAALAAAIAAFITILFLWQQVKNAKNVYVDSKKASQANVILHFQDSFSLNKEMRELRMAIVETKPILKENGGKFERHELYSYIETLERLCTLMEEDIVPEHLVLKLFGPPIAELFINKETRSFIEHHKKGQGKMIWGGITFINDKFKGPKTTHKIA